MADIKDIQLESSAVETGSPVEVSPVPTPEINVSELPTNTSTYSPKTSSVPTTVLNTINQKDEKKALQTRSVASNSGDVGSAMSWIDVLSGKRPGTAPEN